MTETAKPRRRRYMGSIEPMPDGRWRPRLPKSVGRARLDPCASYEEATEALDAALAEIAEGSRVLTDGETLRAWGARWLDDREIGGIEDPGTDRSRWKLHIDTATFVDWPLASIRPVHIRDWLAAMLRKNAAPGFGHKKAPKRKLGKTTVKNTLNLIRCCLAAAVERELIKDNPAANVHLPKQIAKQKRTFDPWTYLLPEEQEKLLATPAPGRDPDLPDLAAFAMWTGVREGEQWNLELADVHVDVDQPYAVIRFGKQDGSTKGGRIRRVPLFGLGLEATLRQLERLNGLHGKRKNPHRLLWPLPRGERRQEKAAPRGWRTWLLAAGIVPEKRHDRRPVRWHDLRHTCASSLVAGWRGRRWSLQEVKELLGHRSITTTERYAHLAESALHVAARETERAGRSAHDLPTHRQASNKERGPSMRNYSGAPETTRTSDLRFRKSEISGAGTALSSDFGQITGRTSPAVTVVQGDAADPEAAAALALIGRQVLVESLAWDAMEATLVPGVSAPSGGGAS